LQNLGWDGFDAFIWVDNLSKSGWLISASNLYFKSVEAKAFGGEMNSLVIQ
jgi:hypothetical protein